MPPCVKIGSPTTSNVKKLKGTTSRRSLRRQRNLTSDEAVFIDLRDIRELQREGKIPGARHVPRGMLEFWIDPQSPYHKPLFTEKKRFIFYCNLGWRSALAAQVAQVMGLENLCHIGGGFDAWVKAGGPVEELRK